jgi:hypothetical protein
MKLPCVERETNPVVKKNKKYQEEKVKKNERERAGRMKKKKGMAAYQIN